MFLSRFVNFKVTKILQNSQGHLTPEKCYNLDFPGRSPSRYSKMTIDVVDAQLLTRKISVILTPSARDALDNALALATIDLYGKIHYLAINNDPPRILCCWFNVYWPDLFADSLCSRSSMNPV